MFKTLNKIYLSQLFRPNWLSLFINPFFFIRRRLFNAIKKKSNALSGILLDLGCGNKPYKNLFTNVSKYIGVDIENPGHDHSKEDIDVYYDGKTLPFNQEHFDSVFFSEVLEHVFNADEILDEIHRVLKKDGIILLTVPFIWDEHEVPNDFGRYTTFGIQHLLEKHKFEIIEIEKTGNFFEVLVQLFIHYLRHLLYSPNKYINLLINLIFIAPFTIIGLILSIIVPKKKSLYFNNVVLARKK